MSSAGALITTQRGMPSEEQRLAQNLVGLSSWEFENIDFFPRLRKQVKDRQCLNYLAFLEDQFARRGTGPEGLVSVWKSKIMKTYPEFGFVARPPSWDMKGGWSRFAHLSEDCMPGDLKRGDTEVVAIKMWIPRDLDIWKEFCRVFASSTNLVEMELHFDSRLDWPQHFEFLSDLGLNKLCVNFVALEKGWLRDFKALEVLSVRGHSFLPVQEELFPPTISTVRVVDQDFNSGNVAGFLTSIPKNVRSLTLRNFVLSCFFGATDAVFGPYSHFKRVVLEGELSVFGKGRLDYLATLLDGNTVLKTLEVDILHPCVFEVFARHAKALQTLRFRRAILWDICGETLAAFKESSLEHIEFLGPFFDAPILSPTDLLLRQAEQQRRKADQRALCLLFCCLQQAPHNAPDKTTTLGAIPLHVLEQSVKDAANCFITEKPDAPRKRAAQSAQGEPATKKRQPPEGPTH